ncbi:hypothetical protein K458DRAFT_409870 [Lentithecium fluviatile CBS 122367]|uniref:DUF7918 domain-containing protein n=1 Tax=Lentithecium fluviatile CBS 122367 TaxID=1168545 RepID=A0A6G1IGF1_9PLEO|nr:hypothetical protein K458DRAFT_409870 [Lentithecium fluviatile CBS 122367]
MAVHPHCDGLEATIAVNGSTLKEYGFDDGDASSRNLQCYIEAKSGAIFEVRYRFSDPFPADRAVSMIVTIDSKDVDEPIVRPRELHDINGHASEGHITNTQSEFYVQRYTFTPLDIEEADLEPVPEAVKFFLLEALRRNKTMEFQEKDVEDLSTVSEKAVKGKVLFHAFNLAAAKPTKALDIFDAEYADGGEPFATFYFHYRSHGALKDLHVIPSTPDPVDLEDCNDDTFQSAGRTQLQCMFAPWKCKDELRRRMKRERSSSVTVVDDDDVGDKNNDVIFVRTGRDLKRAKLPPQLLGEDDEVIELD